MSAPVVINEVAWSGTQASFADEWIELYNRANVSVDLAGFTLYATDLSPYIPLSGSIPPRGYYLIERKNTGETNEANESPIKNITADLWTSFGEGLNNNGEHLILARTNGNATTTADEILKCVNWCARGNGPPHYYSMERYSADFPGTDVASWGTNNPAIRNGVDTNGLPIIGTPKAKNYVSYLLNRNQEITADLTLTKDGGPYVVNDVTVNVKAGATLTLESGVVVKFYDKGRLSANGNIIARGTSADKVVFTSLTDDEYGGDLNGDGICEPGNASSTARCPQAGEWFGVELSAQSAGSSFDNTVIRYGGMYFDGQPQKRANLYINGASPSITNSVIEYSKQYGLYLVNASSTISGNTFRRNNKSNLSIGLYGKGGAPVVSGNTFADNTSGLLMENSSGVFESNIFTGNTYRAIEYNGLLGGYFSNNSGSGNAVNGIILYGNITQGGGRATLKANGLPYVFNIGTVTAVASSTLTIEPGTTVKFEEQTLDVFGDLNIGGAGGIVLFTSSSDDSDGNDVHGNGATVGNIGWRPQGTRLKPGSTSRIENTEFRFMRTALTYDNSPIYLDTITFSNNNLGVSAAAGETILRANNITFTNNTATSTIPLIAP